MLVDDSQRDDFFTEVVQAGHNRSDFEIDERENPMQGEEVQAVTGTATVTQKFSGRQKAYRVGYGSAWVADFSADLARGFFD